MKRLSRAVLFLLVPLVITAQPIESENPEELRSWLERSANQPGYVDVLINLLNTAPDMATFAGYLDTYFQNVSIPESRARVAREVAALYETANRFDEAARWYGIVLGVDPTDWDTTIRRSAMSIELGEYAEAIELLGRVIRSAPSRSQQRFAAILRARAFLLDGQGERAYRHAQSLVGDPPYTRVEPAALLVLYESAVATEQVFELEQIETAISSIAPGGPVAGIIEGTASYLPSPSRLIPGISLQITPAVVERPVESREPPDRGVRGIQVGSFRDPENAQYMRRDIENLGFSAVVEEYQVAEQTFYRVLVPVPATENADEALVIELKERGIEGMRVFN